jgi:DNA repair protein RadA/Sms
MARASTAFVCSACAAETPRWMGQCPGCGEWNTLNEETRGGVGGRAGSPAKRAEAARPQRQHEGEGPM